MGAFDLTNAQLKCLKASEWLNDEVINAYMSLLSLRCIVRCKKYLEGLADGAGNEGDETDRELQEVGDTDREQELEGVGDADREQDAIGCDGPQQEKKTAERDQRRARRRGDAFSGSSDDGQLRSKAAQESDNENTASKPPPNCVFFSSFFYTILRNAKGGYDFDNVRRWSRNKVGSRVHAGFRLRLWGLGFSLAAGCTRGSASEHVCACWLKYACAWLWARAFALPSREVRALTR